jgi:5-methylcytosine-specific restriction endonuclease McrA
MPKIERPAIKRNSGLRAKVFERDQGFCVDCGRFSPRWQHDHDTSLAVAQQVEDNLCGSTPFAAKSRTLRSKA